jgi:hypothetical protein
VRNRFSLKTCILLAILSYMSWKFRESYMPPAFWIRVRLCDKCAVSLSRTRLHAFTYTLAGLSTCLLQRASSIDMLILLPVQDKKTPLFLQHWRKEQCDYCYILACQNNMLILSTLQVRTTCLFLTHCR